MSVIPSIYNTGTGFIGILDTTSTPPTVPNTTGLIIDELGRYVRLPVNTPTVINNTMRYQSGTGTAQDPFVFTYAP